METEAETEAVLDSLSNTIENLDTSENDNADSEDGETIVSIGQTDSNAGLPNSGGLLGPADLAGLTGSSANLLSAQDLADLSGCESFDAEAEATARLQGVLASELIPLKTTVKDTSKNVVDLTSKCENMETVLSSLSNTIETLHTTVKDNTSSDGENDGITNRRTSNPGAVKRSSVKIEDLKNIDVGFLDQLVTRVEHLSSDVVRIDTNRQFLEDNLLLRRELQTYTEREVNMNERLEQLEKRLNDLKNEK